MNQYFSTFASGLDEVVKTALKDKVQDVEIKLLLDGLVVYDTGLGSGKIKEIRFFNNSFILLSFAHDSLKVIMKQALDNPDLVAKIKKYIPGRNCSFRIVTSEENQLVAVDKNLLTKLEEVFSRVTGMRVNRSNPDCEI